MRGGGGRGGGGGEEEEEGKQRGRGGVKWEQSEVTVKWW